MTDTKHRQAPAGTLLLIGNYRPALTLAKTFSDKGYRVVVGAHGCDGGCEKSRFVDAIWDHTDGQTDPGGFLDDLYRFTDANQDLAAILPVSEDYVRLFAEHPKARTTLPPIAMVAPDLVRTCLDKPAMMALAEKHGVPTAPFALVENATDYAAETARIGLPLVIRPVLSTKRLNGKKALILEAEAELADFVPDWQSDRDGLILQAKAAGTRHNLYFAAHEGRVVRLAHAVIARTDRIDGTGLAVEGVTIDPDPELRGYTETLIEALDYSGIGCAQFLVDPESGSVSFLEINPRIAGNHAVAERAGLDLGAFLLDGVLGRVPDLEPRVGTLGIRYVWTSADLEAAKSSYLRGDISAAKALSWTARAIGAGLTADVHMVFSLRDPLPGLSALWSVMPRLARWRPPATQSTSQPISSFNAKRTQS